MELRLYRFGSLPLKLTRLLFRKPFRPLFAVKLIVVVVVLKVLCRISIRLLMPDSVRQQSICTKAFRNLEEIKLYLSKEHFLLAYKNEKRMLWLTKSRKKTLTELDLELSLGRASHGKYKETHRISPCQASPRSVN